MSIEFEFNSVVISTQEIQEKYPDIYSAIKTYLPRQEARKRRRSKRTKKLVTALIADIIKDINAE